MSTDPRADTGLGTPDPADAVEMARVRGAVASRLLGEVEGTVRIGRYAVLSKLGEGGMGVVYAGFDDQLDRKVAIKVLRAGFDNEALRLRMLREAQALARLSHPNVVHVYEVGTHDGRTFLAMEFVRGATLREWVREQPRTWHEILAMYAQAGAGLAAAHSTGLVHRDFKPDNVLVGRDGRARVLDFGLARHDAEAVTTSMLQTAMPPSGEQVDRLGTPLTLAGSMMGTPAYMAPEQFLGDPTDARTDQFGFCVALYEALYGERPFAGATRTELVAAVTRGAVRPASRGVTVPAWLRATVLRGLSVAPSHRFGDMHALLAALARDPARARRRMGVAAVMVAGIAGLVVARGTASPGASPCSGAEASLAEVVDEDRIERTLAAIDGIGLPFAAATATRLRGELQTYTQAWIAGHRDACEATTVRGEQSADLLDRRMACLHTARAELGALLGVLETPSAALVEHVDAQLQRITPVSRCANLEALRDGTPPPDAAIAAEVDALRARTLGAAARVEASRDPAAIAELDAIIARAEILGYRPLQAMALFHGVDQHVPAQALERLNRAHIVAIEARDGELARRTASMLASILAERSRLDEARTWLDIADAWAQRDPAASTPEARAGLANNRALVESAAGRYPEALATIEAAMAESELPARVRAFTLLSHASLLSRGGGIERAATQANAAYDALLALYGPDHPMLAQALNMKAAIAYRQGRLDQMRAYAEQSLELITRTRGPDDPRALNARNNLAVAARTQGRYDEALAQLLALRESVVRVHGEDSEAFANNAYNLAFTLQSAGRDAEALPHAERALASRQRMLGPDHPQIAATLGVLAGIRLNLGDVDNALRDARAGRDLAERLYPPGHDTMLVARVILARVLGAAGQVAAARTEIDRALAALDGAPATLTVVNAYAASAEIAEKTGDLALAGAHHRRALELGTGTLPDDHPQLSFSRERLAALPPADRPASPSK